MPGDPVPTPRRARPGGGSSAIVANEGVIGRLGAVAGETRDSHDAVREDDVDRDRGGGQAVPQGVDGHIGDRLDRGGRDERAGEIADAAESSAVDDLGRRLRGNHQQTCDDV